MFTRDIKKKQLLLFAFESRQILKAQVLKTDLI